VILTGNAIREAVKSGEIVIDPFTPGAVNPNSYNYRLGDTIFRIDSDSCGRPCRTKLEPENGRVLLEKGRLYLGHTQERIGSCKYVTSLIGRSSIGRLGIFVQVSANLGHVGAIHRWTLEIVPTLDVYAYPGQTFGQVSFWSCVGTAIPYAGWFGFHDEPMPSKLHDRRFGLETLERTALDTDRR
jgi:dCTP deaminase